jgi:pilus assembly protein CpaC
MASALIAPSASLAKERLIEFSNGRAGTNINVAKGQFLTARTRVDIGQVMVGDPEIANAVPINGRTFHVLGRGEGRTTVAVYGADNTLLGTVSVEVGADAPDLEISIQQAIPKANVRVETVNGRLRLSGTVPDSISLRRALEIAEQYGAEGIINSLRVTGGQQVMLEVRLVEASRNAGRELGVSWFAQRRNESRGRGFASGSVLPDFADPSGIRFNANLPDGSPPFGTLIAEVLGGGVSADVLVQALEAKGLARRLAEPNLIALSGEKASFLAGGEVPIPVAAEDNQVTVQFKEYGVRLNFTPIVLDNGLINLKLEPEVSQVDESVRVSTGLVSIPSFITRRASTTIEVRDGQSFAMAGLLQSNHVKNQDQLPWLGQVPILGALFRSSSFQEQETDLVIIVTPRLVKPARPGQPLRTPLDSSMPSNDAEFFLLGQLEVSKDTLERFSSGSGIIGPYGHIIDLSPRKSHARKKSVTKTVTRRVVKD